MQLTALIGIATEDLTVGNLQVTKDQRVFLDISAASLNVRTSFIALLSSSPL
jgi:hypothetical protein